MSAASKPRIGHEQTEYILQEWAANLARAVGEHNHFGEKWYPDNNRGLTAKQSLSEKAFVLFAYGLTYTVGVVSDKAADKIAETKLVDAWRKNVWRNSFQQRYNVFEDLLKETLSTLGAKVAIAAYPKTTTDPEAVIEAIKFYGYQPKSLDLDIVSDLIRRTNAKPQAPKGNDKGSTSLAA